MQELIGKLQLSPADYLLGTLDWLTAPFVSAAERFVARRRPRFWALLCAGCALFHVLAIALPVPFFMAGLIPSAWGPTLQWTLVGMLVINFVAFIYSYSTAVDRRTLDGMLKLPLAVPAAVITLAFFADRMSTNIAIYRVGTAIEGSPIHRLLYRTGFNGWTADVVMMAALAIALLLLFRRRSSCLTTGGALREIKAVVWMIVLIKAAAALGNFAQLLFLPKGGMLMM